MARELSHDAVRGRRGEYTLTNSGHVAGIVNPPGRKKSLYYTKPRATRGESADEWRESATATTGSWWEDWAAWAASARRGCARPTAPAGRAGAGRYVRNEDGGSRNDPGAPKARRHVSDEENGRRRLEKPGRVHQGQRELANLSLRQLAEIAKISNPYLSQVERGLYKPSADVLKQIANALHISAETMYAQAGLLDGSEPRPRAIMGSSTRSSSTPGSTVDQKEALIRIYRSFTGGVRREAHRKGLTDAAGAWYT